MQQCQPCCFPIIRRTLAELPQQEYKLTLFMWICTITGSFPSNRYGDAVQIVLHCCTMIVNILLGLKGELARNCHDHNREMTNTTLPLISGVNVLRRWPLPISATSYPRWDTDRFGLT